MATLILDRVWVNRLDSGQAVSAQSGTDRARSHAMDGEVRTYAGGRQRAYTTVGERGQFEVTLRMVSQATIDVLRSWIGVPVQVRDARGQRFVGIYFEVPVSELRSAAFYDVRLSVRTLTVAEGV